MSEIDFEVRVIDPIKRKSFEFAQAAIENCDIGYVEDMLNYMSPETKDLLIKFATLIHGAFGLDDEFVELIHTVRGDDAGSLRQ